MLVETAVTQRSPSYSAVSDSLVNPLPDYSNYSPFYHTHYLILQINTSLLQRFTAESSRDLMSLWIISQCLVEAEQQAEASGDVPPLQIDISTTFCLFLFSLLPFSIISLLPFLISPRLSTIPSFSSDPFSVLLRQKLQLSFS